MNERHMAGKRRGLKVAHFFTARQGMRGQHFSCPQVERSFEEWWALTGGRRPHTLPKGMEEERLKLSTALCGLENSPEQAAQE